MNDPSPSLPARDEARSTSYDVIIVGGRPAGASLAARLGAAGLSVLVVDKARFPSAPEVPSCPVLYQKSLALLGELGLAEERLMHALTPVRTMAITLESEFEVHMRVPELFGRDYLCGVDRPALDAALWDHLGSVPGVTRRAGFRVDDVTRDAAGRVTGILGAEEGRPAERISAGLCVVGADGRHSLLARKVRARVTEDAGERTSTCHFAPWEDVAPLPGTSGAVVHTLTGGDGVMVLFFPSTQGRTRVALQVRSDRADLGSDPQAYYLRHLAAFPTVQRRLAGARQVGPLLGVKKIANRYREAAGPGWALVGDAVCHKDPLDGQGIYDALIESKRLAELLASVRRGALAPDALAPAYTRALAEETAAMFRATTERLERDLYGAPGRVLRTLMRWALQDPAYQRQFFRMLARDLDPTRWLTPGLLLRAVLRGLLGDLFGRSRGAPAIPSPKET